MTSLLYIGGYGRSGSTLLDRLVGGHRRVFSVGELGRLPRTTRRPDNYRCSCGQQIDQCAVWPLVWKQTAATLSLTTDELNVNSSFPQVDGWRAFLPGGNRAAKAQFAAYSNALLESIIDVVHDHDFIVDSSKTGAEFAARPLAFHRLAGQDVRLVHIMRDGRGVMWSRIKSQERKYDTVYGLRKRLMEIARTSLSWHLANLAAYVSGLRLPNGRIVITYERLASDHEAVMSELFTALGLDPEDTDHDEIRHQAHGNRMRMASNIEISLDESWRRNLTRVELIAFWIMGWPSQLAHRRYRRLGR